MNWIAISDGGRALRRPPAAAPGAAPLLSVGTLVIETRFSALAHHRQVLVSLSREAGWPRLFRLSLRARGDLYLEHRQGDTAAYALLDFPEPELDATLRITLAWHAPERVGMLSVENLDTGAGAQEMFDAPCPWPMDDLAALFQGSEGVRLDPAITCLACADTLVPVGLTSGFAAGTLVGTAAGPRPVETLAPGDLVQTYDAGLQPVRLAVGHEVPALGRFAPVEMLAPFFRLGRDLTVAPQHRILIDGADAEYLFGADAVLVAARQLLPLTGAVQPRTPATMRYVQVLLDSHQCLSVSGAWGESLFIGDLADDPVRHAMSALDAVPADHLPRHTRIASPHVRGYEAMVLVSELSA